MKDFSFPLSPYNIFVFCIPPKFLRYRIYIRTMQIALWSEQVSFLCTFPTTKKWIICNNYLWIQILDTFFPSSTFFLFLFPTLKTHPRSKSCTWMFYALFQRGPVGKKPRKDKASSVENFHILNMDDIQMWEEKDRLLFIVKFQRMQTLFHCPVLRYSQSCFAPNLKEWREPPQFIYVKHWKTSEISGGKQRSKGCSKNKIISAIAKAWL